MANRGDAIQIELLLRRDGLQEIRRGADVMERARPAAAGIAEPPVLDVPRGDAGTGQRVRERAHVIDRGGARIHRAELRHPAAAVDDDRDWMRAFRVRNTKLAKLERI